MDGAWGSPVGPDAPNESFGRVAYFINSLFHCLLSHNIINAARRWLSQPENGRIAYLYMDGDLSKLTAIFTFGSTVENIVVEYIVENM